MNKEKKNPILDYDYKKHWDKTYTRKKQEELGWYETDLSPSLKLISKTGLDKSACILNAGAGNTTLIDALIEEGYSNLIATDISLVALEKLKSRMATDKVRYIIDDLTKPVNLLQLSPVDLWIDRALLHFFIEEKDQDSYFDLLRNKISLNGFVIFAEFNMDGAEKCSGLPVKRYNTEMLSNKLGSDFTLSYSFDHSYEMPSGDLRPYIYSLFKRIK